MRTYEIRPIAHIESDFTTKFGIPRQSGIADKLEANIVFEKEYRIEEALRGIEEFSHLWLIWQFSENLREDWSPTVRPPRLGGNKRLGVFATRSPFRPNALGLSCVRLVRVDRDESRGTFLVVAGADLMNGTPIFDIKPYIPYTDCRTDALSGFAPDSGETLEVEFTGDTKALVPTDKLDSLTTVLANDPRPRYHHDSERTYVLEFAGMNISFVVDTKKLYVIKIIKSKQ